MTIAYPRTLPTITGIQSISLRARTATAISRSPFTYKEQVLSHQGQRWEAEVSLPPMKRAAAEEWVAFLVSLKGQFGTFLLGDPSAATPRGSASTSAGTPLVNGASQTGDTLAIDGLPTSVTGYLLAGDYIRVGTGSASRLYKVLQNVNTNSSGQATLDIFPTLRASPSDNQTVFVSSAKGVFRLASNEANWSINQAETFGINFAAIEAVT